MYKMMRRWVLVVLIGLCPYIAQAQLTTRSEDIVSLTHWVTVRMPDRRQTRFVSPSQRDIVIFKTALHALLSERWAEANAAAVQIGYTVVPMRTRDSQNEVLYALTPTAQNTDGRSHFVVRPGRAVVRNLVVEVPHPYHDIHTAALGSRIFQVLGARAFAFAGVPRCANLERPSPCDGRTRACGSRLQPYRESDLAHTDKSFFHVFHQTLEQVYPGKMIFLQVHGFYAGTNDPAFIVSDGTRIDQPSADYITNKFALTLEDHMAVNGFPKRGVSCNRTGNPDRLCGTTNVQGRFTNGITTDQCTTRTRMASGRFIHLELSQRLREPRRSPHSQMVIDAIQAALPSR
jgi:hypothetical protein